MRPDRRGTDLEAALDAARGELAPDHVPRLVLFSDGHPTAGDTGPAVTRLAAERIPVSVEPLAPRSIGDTWIDALDLPARITAGALAAGTVTVGSQRDGSGEIKLKATLVDLTGKPAARTGAAASGAAVARRAVTFQKGMTPVALDSPSTRRALRARGALSAPGDPLAANNVLGQGGVGRAAAEGALRRRRAGERALSGRRARRRRLRRDGAPAVGLAATAAELDAVRRRRR